MPTPDENTHKKDRILIETAILYIPYTIYTIYPLPSTIHYIPYRALETPSIEPYNSLFKDMMSCLSPEVLGAAPGSRLQGLHAHLGRLRKQLRLWLRLLPRELPLLLQLPGLLRFFFFWCGGVVAPVRRGLRVRSMSGTVVLGIWRKKADNSPGSFKRFTRFSAVAKVGSLCSVVTFRALEATMSTSLNRKS